MSTTLIYLRQFKNDLYDHNGFKGSDDMDWIGYDLDNTLVQYHGWKGADHIGEDNVAVCESLAKDLMDGKRVKIFTARVSGETNLNAVISNNYIRAWCWIKFGTLLEVTNVKDTRCVKLYDDIATEFKTES